MKKGKSLSQNLGTIRFVKKLFLHNERKDKLKIPRREGTEDGDPPLYFPEQQTNKQRHLSPRTI